MLVRILQSLRLHRHHTDDISLCHILTISLKTRIKTSPFGTNDTLGSPHHAFSKE